MFPILLDLTRIPVLLAARGKHVQKRLGQLQEAGATDVRVFSDALPRGEDFDGVKLALVAGLATEDAAHVAALARACGVLVNVEDVIPECDFFYPAVVRRGELVIAASTCGASPVLAQLVRDDIAARFGEEWRGRTQTVKELRRQWRAEGKNGQELAALTREYVAAQGWLTKDAA